MNDADRYKLHHGPYHSPRCRIGGRLDCEARGSVVVKRMSAGRIPWPQTIVKRSRAFILCGGLVKAVRLESEIAVAHWWGVTEQTVWQWRKALGVPRTNEGSRRLWRKYFNERVDDVQPLAVFKAGDPERRAKISAARKGKPRPPHVGEAVARAHRDTPHTEATRQKMSEAHRRRGTRPPAAGKPWAAVEDAMVKRFRPPVVAQRTGRTLGAIYTRRQQLGLPDGRAGRKSQRCEHDA